MLPTYSTLLKLAWRQYVQYFDLILYGHLCFTLPAVAVVAYLKEWFPIQDEVVVLADLWPNFMIQLALDNAAAITTSVVGIVIVMGMRRALQAQSTHFTAVLKEAMPFYLPMMGLQLLSLILIIVGLGLFILPGMIISVVLTFAVPAMAWHRLSIIQAMRHSIQIVRGQFWRVFLYGVMVQLVVMAVILMVTWGLPVNFYFDIFATWLSAVCASFFLVFVTIMMNAAEALAELAKHTKPAEPTSITK